MDESEKEDYKKAKAYAKRRLESGSSLSAVREALKKADYSEDLIDEVLSKEATREPTSEPKHRSLAPLFITISVIVLVIIGVFISQNLKPLEQEVHEKLEEERKERPEELTELQKCINSCNFGEGDCMRCRGALNHDASYCDRIVAEHPEEQEQTVLECKDTLAIYYGTLERTTQEFKSELYSNEEFTTLYQAILDSNLNACGNLDLTFFSVLCESVLNNDASLCGNSGDTETCTSDFYLITALLNNDASLCDNIPSFTTKKDCLAVLTKDAGQCEEIAEFFCRQSY
jgi:hypothetical protein